MSLLEAVLKNEHGRRAQGLPTDVSISELSWYSIVHQLTGEDHRDAIRVSSIVSPKSAEDVVFLQNVLALARFYRLEGRQALRTSADSEEARLALWINRMRTWTSQGRKGQEYRQALDTVVPWWSVRVNDAMWIEKKAEALIASLGLEGASTKYASTWRSLTPAEKKVVGAMLPEVVPRSMEENHIIRAGEIVEWAFENGRLPISGAAGQTTRERTLGSSLSKFRVRARNDDLPVEVSSVIASHFPRWLVVRKTEDWFFARLADLKAYKAANGRWPRVIGAEDDEEKSVGIWLQNQRMAKRKNGNYVWNADREKALDSECPGWDSGTSWTLLSDENLELLRDFYLEQGRWPRKEKKVGLSQEENKLGTWLDNQRTRYRNGKMSPDREASLDTISPSWRGGRSSRPKTGSQ